VLIKVFYVETLTYSDVIRCDSWVNQNGPYLKNRTTITESDKATESKAVCERLFIFFPQIKDERKERRGQYFFTNYLCLVERKHNEIIRQEGDCCIKFAVKTCIKQNAALSG